MASAIELRGLMIGLGWRGLAPEQNRDSLDTLGRRLSEVFSETVEMARAAGRPPILLKDAADRAVRIVEDFLGFDRLIHVRDEHGLFLPKYLSVSRGRIHEDVLKVWRLYLSA